MKLLGAVIKLMRFKPVISWTICGFLLALSVAYYETGAILNQDLLIVSFVAIMVIQGILSHAVNDLCDEEVDRDADVETTGRTKVLISGMATRRDLVLLSLVVVFISLIVMTLVYNRLGYIILLFGSVGLYAAIGYSVNPLKLGWRPFSEWTVVFPVITTLVVAVNYLATEYISYLAVIVGATHAMYNIRWFMDSRMIDIESDSEHGKITTPVFMRNHCVGGNLSDFYVLMMCIMFAYGFCRIHFVLIVPLLTMIGYLYTCMIFTRGECVTCNRSRSYYVKSRLAWMRLTVFNAVIMSSYLLFQKVYIL